MNDKWGLTVRGIYEIDGEILLLKIRSKSNHTIQILNQSILHINTIIFNNI